jgi:uncharacterized protein (DUF3084 family)
VRAFEETKTQLEEDADREIDKLKEKYEALLHAEHESGLRLKGENGIMRKKFAALKRDIKTHEDDIAALNEQKTQLNLTIQNLENEMGSLRKEIAARDETIGDKERRIGDMKKKTMELEKFKFILDFKVGDARDLELGDAKTSSWVTLRARELGDANCSLGFCSGGGIAQANRAQGARRGHHARPAAVHGRRAAAVSATSPPGR